MRSIEHIVAEQIERWRIERIKAEKKAVKPSPVVAVSREYGARGAAVAHVVAERLGFTYWNRELVDEIARSKQVSTALVETFDEHHDPVLLATYRELVRGKLGPSEYFAELVKVVHAISSHGGAVLVGRGITYMLPAERVFRVRVVCPMEQRIAGLVTRRGIEADAARAEIVATDRERHAFVKDHLGRDVTTAADYDLHVNTDSYSVEHAGELVVAAYHMRFGVTASAPPSSETRARPG